MMGKEYWLVDCDDLRKLVNELNEKAGEDPVLIKGVLLTHAHYDYI